MPKTAQNSRIAAVDTYIAGAKPFARPILTTIREAIHRVVPEVEEAIKWSRPFFVYKGVILGNISGFKEHCSFGLWGSEMADALRQDGVDSHEGMGTFGRITSLEDLPSGDRLEGYIRRAVALIDDGQRSKSIQRVAKPSQRKVEMPEVLLTALREQPKLRAKFEALSPSCRAEYAVWIGEAKRQETQQKRLATALEWIGEGKSRNWKYEKAS